MQKNRKRSIDLQIKPKPKPKPKPNSRILKRIKSSIHFASVTAIKIAFGLVIIKVVAYKLGPEDFGLISQLMTIVAIVGMFAGGGISKGLIKTLAENPISTQEGRSWLSSATTLSITISIATALLLISISSSISEKILTENLAPVIIIIAASQLISAYGSIIISESSSRGDSKFYAKANIFGTTFGSLAIIFSTHYCGFNGAAYAIAAAPSLISISALIIALRENQQAIRILSIEINPKKFRYLLKFSAITLAGATSVPFAQIFIREIISLKYGWEYVGYWQGVLKLSDTYMQLVGIILINYFLPRASKATDQKQKLNEFIDITKWLTMFLTLGISAVYFGKDLIIPLIFSKQFMPMQELMLPQFIGDIFRTIASAASILLISKGSTRLPIAFEVSQGILLAIFFNFLIEMTAEKSPAYAHLLTYTTLAVIMCAALYLPSIKSNDNQSNPPRDQPPQK